MRSFAQCRVTHRVCVCVCEREWGEQGHITVEWTVDPQWISDFHQKSQHVGCLNRGLSTANTYEHHHCICHATLFSFRAWTDGKTNDIINCLYIYFESWSSIIVRGITFLTHACGVWPITMHCVSWPIRADCAYRKKGLCRKHVWDRRGIEELQ